jgi:multicomponent Na+:H+ antiporter subunit E
MNRPTAGEPRAPRPAPRLADAVIRGAMLTSIWWVLAEGSPGTPLLAIAVILTATATSFALVPAVAWRLPLRALVLFIPYFLGQSLRGGLDVARRALHPQLLIDPGFVEHEMSLPPGAARTAFIGILSLLPGTLSVRLTLDRTLRIHVLDLASIDPARLRELEHRVAMLFDPGSQREPKPSGSKG